MNEDFPLLEPRITSGEVGVMGVLVYSWTGIWAHSQPTHSRKAQVWKACLSTCDGLCRVGTWHLHRGDSQLNFTAHRVGGSAWASLLEVSASLALWIGHYLRGGLCAGLGSDGLVGVACGEGSEPSEFLRER